MSSFEPPPPPPPRQEAMMLMLLLPPLTLKRSSGRMWRMRYKFRCNSTFDP